PAVAPVRRHLAGAGIRVLFGGHGGEQLVVGRDAQAQRKSAVAVVGEEPVVAGPQQQPGGGQNGLVSHAIDLEIDAILPLEYQLFIVKPARSIHRSIRADEGRRGKRKTAFNHKICHHNYGESPCGVSSILSAKGRHSLSLRFVYFSLYNARYFLQTAFLLRKFD